MIYYVDGACSGNGTNKSSGGYGVVGMDEYGVKYCRSLFLHLQPIIEKNLKLFFGFLCAMD